MQVGGLMRYRSADDRLSGRFWEIDFLRGIALILMVYFHIIFDLNEIYGLPVSYTSGINYYIGKISGITFIFIAGISGAFSRNNVKRGLKVLGIALVLSAVTHIYGEEFGIKFGILHLLGLCMILYPLLNKLNSFILTLTGIFVLLGGLIVKRVTVTHDAFFFLGIISNSFQSSDYYPLIPWSGIFILGMAAYKFMDAMGYFDNKKTGKSNIMLPDNPINMAGRCTLIIYILHQPVILLVLELIKAFIGLG